MVKTELSEDFCMSKNQHNMYRAVANGEVEECEVPEDELPYERQGASTGWYALLGMFGAMLFRRRIKK